MNAAVDVLLPFHVEAPGLDAAIASIVGQTYADWHLILIDNRAAPAALKIAQRWAHADARIRLIHEQEQGIAHALNAGLRIVTAPLVARMDSDDLCHPERFAQQVALLGADATLGAVACRVGLTSTLPDYSGLRHFVDWQNSVVSAEEHALSRFIESPVAHPSVMFRAALIHRHGPYSTAAVPEDYELWLRWMDAAVRMAKVDEVLLTWHDSPGRLTRTHPHYAHARFLDVKGQYLSRWMERHVPTHRKVTVCGTSKWGVERALHLQGQGLRIDACTDIQGPRQAPFAYVHPDDAVWRGDFLLGLVAKRGVRQAMRTHFVAQGLIEGIDFLMAA